MHPSNGLPKQKPCLTPKPGSLIKSLGRLATQSSALPGYGRRTRGWLLCALALISFAQPVLAQLPPGWTDEDIGFPSQIGSGSAANGVWSVAGGGSDIWNSSDQFNFAYETASDSVVLIARVVALANTDSWAKAGVMLRDSNDPSAIYADVVATPGNGVSFQWRGSTGGQCGFSQVGGIFTPVWVKLVRSGNQFSGYYSPDGAGWTPIGPSETLPMG